MRKCIQFAIVATAIAAPAVAWAGEQIIPAGSLVQCMVAEPKLSSKTTEVGDPVLCRVTHVESYGHSLPYGTVLVGRFEDYKDPGHLLGKGWMELKFERMVTHDQVIPLEAKVVGVPGYNVDRAGRILGKGHPVRDVVEWSIPLLWPIDLLNLPRRGPRPTLKGETRLTLKVMDDTEVPDLSAPQPAYGLQQRPAPAAYTPAPPPAPPMEQSYAAPAPAYDPAPQPAYAPAVYEHGPYAAVVGGPLAGQSAPMPSSYGYAPGTPVVVMRDGVPFRAIAR